MSKILEYTKAIAALLGAIITALLGVLPPDEYRWLVLVGIVLTALATYQLPNRVQPDGAHEAGVPVPQWDGITLDNNTP